MAARESLLHSRPSLRERGNRELAAREAERREGIERNIAEGKRQLRRSFVFRFYHDTMIDTHLSGACHKFGPNSPDPDIRPVRQPHGLGGGYHGVPWEFEYDGIRWRAVYRYGYESWGLHFCLHFYVRARPRRFRARQWIEVWSPAGVVEALT